MIINRQNYRVRWADCDPADLIFYPNYFVCYDEGTWSLFKNAGLTRQTLLDDYGCVSFPLLEAKSKFLAPSRFHDDLVIESQIVTWRNKTFDVSHKVINGTVLAAEGLETRAWCGPHPDDPKRLKAVPIPRAIIDILGG